MVVHLKSLGHWRAPASPNDMCMRWGTSRGEGCTYYTGKVAHVNRVGGALLVVLTAPRHPKRTVRWHCSSRHAERNLRSLTGQPITMGGFVERCDGRTRLVAYSTQHIQIVGDGDV